MSQMIHLEELLFNKPIRQHVKEFGILFGIIFFIVGAWLMYKAFPLEFGLSLIGLGAVSALMGYQTPNLLYPLWKGWMAFAHVLGTIMTTVILGIAWTLLVIPFAVALKVLGKKVMDMSFDRTRASYWQDREEKQHDFKRLEQQF